MPTSVIHEIVAKKITTSNKMLDNYNFYDSTKHCAIWIDKNGELQCKPYYEAPRYKENIYKL